MKLSLRGDAAIQSLCRGTGLALVGTTLAALTLPSQARAEAARFRDLPVAIF